MTDTQLGNLLRQVPDELDPAAADRILHGALEDGARRRRGRRLAVAGAGLSTAAVVAAVAAVSALGVDGSGTSTDDPATTTTTTTSPSSPSPTGAPSPTVYPEGSRTQVPGGPVIETDRAVAEDPVLLAAARDLLPAGVASGLDVSHTWSSDPSHMADESRDGRAVSLSLDGASVTVTIQRWDGYAAVGVGNLEEMRDHPEDGFHPEQKAATTAREACAGSYQVMPPIDCTEDAGGWHRVDRPSQGAATPDTYKELFVQLYTDDGYVVTVDSYNTPAEKAGPPVADEPVLTVAESLSLARSDRWFVAE